MPSLNSLTWTKLSQYSSQTHTHGCTQTKILLAQPCASFDSFQNTLRPSFNWEAVKLLLKTLWHSDRKQHRAVTDSVKGRKRGKEDRQWKKTEAFSGSEKYPWREKEKKRLVWKEGEKTRASQREARERGKPRGGRKERRTVRKKKKSELKRLLSGSGTLFLDAHWLSLNARLRGGGTAGSHWCHSLVNRPDRRTIGPHVVVRKLSVSQAAAAHDIIWDQVWNTFAQTVYVTKNIHAYMLNYGSQPSTLLHCPTTHTYTAAHNLTPCGLHPMTMPIPWLSSPPLCTLEALVTGRTTTLGHLHTTTHIHTRTHTSAYMTAGQ